MNKEQKAAVVEEIAAQLSDAGAIFAVDYRGIGVPEAAELRAKLAESDAVFRVVKNRLAKRAAESAGTGELDELLEGPTALTLVQGDPVTAAKALADFAREHDVPTYKGGLMEGAPLDPDRFRRIARLPGVDVLQAQLLGAVASPVTGIARGLNQMLAGLAGQLGQMQDKGLVEGEEGAIEGEAHPAEPDAGASEAEGQSGEAERAGAEDSAGNDEEKPEAQAEEKPEAEGSEGEEPEAEARQPEGEGSEEEQADAEARQPEGEGSEEEQAEAEARQPEAEGGDDEEAPAEGEDGD